MHTNRLVAEKSPYLLQHAHNPVDWFPWGEEAFKKARSESKPVFLSIGYSTCHWCHVMERESFENEEIASVLNRYFVPIKVDREERPDVDRVYMTFVQAATGGGGWPMSVWLTPDLKPFFGGTYFPPDSRYGRPGFRQILEQLGLAWESDRQRILVSGEDALEQLKNIVSVTDRGVVDATLFESGFFQFRRAFDSRLGGFGGAPKFPRPSALHFLFRYGYAKNNDEATEMAVITLREMSKGGMHDHLGGGFHRYSVDARWFVPHFEKMLYDQAQLAMSYLEAFQITREEHFAQVARGIFEYVLRDMTHPDGGFLSAEDADSVIDPAISTEKGEGAFYVWDHAEIIESLGAEAAEIFEYRYGVEPAGNVHEDPHGEFTGKNILYERFSLTETARRFSLNESEVEARLDAASAVLSERRSSRVRPHLDDKILTAWNGLMISAFARGARVLADPRYLEAALRAARFVEQNLQVEDRLLRRWREGEAAIEGFLDDYAFYGQGLLDLYEADFDIAHLRFAVRLTDRMRSLFEDCDNGGFFSVTDTDASIILRFREDYDGAEPSGNSIAVANLLRLAQMTGEQEYRTLAETALRAFAGKLASGPTGLPQMLAAALQSVSTPRQVVLSGDRVLLQPMQALVANKFLPFHTVLLAGVDTVNKELGNMLPDHTGIAAYVCENFTCQLPTSDLQKLNELLQ